jgi:amino-acid N-acetyltransferase
LLFAGIFGETNPCVLRQSARCLEDVMILEKANVDDAADILRLLERNRLPLDGLTDHLATAIVARQDGRIVGSAALEIYSGAALLRSVAVDPALQRHGLGHELTEAALRLARELGVADVYLLTTTAAEFFPKFGFAEIARDEVPSAVKASREFTAACPSSAIVMRMITSDHG